MKAPIVPIAGQVTWQGFRDTKSGAWIGVCEALNLSALGDTWAELQASANEAMELLLVDLLESNELDQFLSANRWRLLTPVPQGVTPQFDLPADWQKTNNAPAFAVAR